MINKNMFPFCAITRQDAVKKALILNYINPKIGGVLISGEKGTAKSTLVRSLAELLDEKIVNVPLNTSEDRLVGSIDLEKTLKTGDVCIQEGLLSKANGKILYVDEVNLLGDHLVDILLEVNGKNENSIERENISYKHEAKFTLVGTMNMEEGMLRPQLLDRFGLFVNATGCRDVSERIEIIKKRLAFEKNPKSFQEKYKDVSEKWKKHILEARRKVSDIEIDEIIYDKIVELCLKAGVHGHRADIVMVQTVKALAAFYQDTEVKEEYVDEAAYFVLPHRIKEVMQDDWQDEEETELENEAEENKSSDCDNRQEQEQQREQREWEGDYRSSKAASDVKTKIFDIGTEFKVKKFSYKKDKKCRSGDGKRTTTNTQSKSGRYVYSTSQRKNNDFALDATIRAAAPYQRFRDKNGLSIAIRSEDIREKVRQKKISNLLVFVVDSSGSMGANERMKETKGAIISLLKDAYVKRDKIAMVSFRGNSSKVLLPPTGSVQRGFKLLQTMETGGKTPLNDGISKGIRIIKNEQKKNPMIMPLLIIITDGRGNVSLDERKRPKQELMEIAEGIHQMSSVNTMVIDIEKSGMMSMGIAKDFAKKLGGQYYKLESLRSDSLLKVVRENTY